MEAVTDRARLVLDELHDDVRVRLLPRSQEEHELHLAAVGERTENAHGDMVVGLPLHDEVSLRLERTHEGRRNRRIADTDEHRPQVSGCRVDGGARTHTMSRFGWECAPRTGGCGPSDG